MGGIEKLSFWSPALLIRHLQQLVSNPFTTGAEVEFLELSN
jgi:hypothetical protein